MFLDRRPRKGDRWLNFKVGAFTAGAALALAGIYFTAQWLVWIAIAVLLVGFGARFFEERGRGHADPSADAPTDESHLGEIREASRHGRHASGEGDDPPREDREPSE